ncbi:hypothetical protein [Gloeocapsa sp. PCC 7428]|uniref:hypothetical protein n=1 Tax=Gloeocapsa sp. PCC 7428 TaxID=1173026 RepID=UPI0012DDCC51|nr:hypothetical protein [Gloeocapsa sp. PCC 7428]
MCGGGAIADFVAPRCSKWRRTGVGWGQYHTGFSNACMNAIAYSAVGKRRKAKG